MNNTETNLVIRPARDEDVPRMREIAVQAWAPVYSDFRERMGEELYRLEMPTDWRADKADQVSDFYREHPNRCLVTEINGRVVGFITFVLYREKSIGEIGNNAVAPDWQGQSIGTAQYHRVLDIFRQEGMKYAKVYTGLDAAHASARAAYEKVGFKPLMPYVTYYRKL